MEDPQAGEILPPMLYEDWFINCLARVPVGEQDILYDAYVKLGMELAYQYLQPYLKAALPYYEAGLRDTRMGQADAGKLAELARYKELATYE